MVLSVSGILLRAAAVLCFMKDGMKLSHGVVCGLFGFYLAGTGAASSVEAGGESLARFLGGIEP